MDCLGNAKLFWEGQTSVDMRPSRAACQFLLPRTVLISPLWQMYLTHARHQRMSPRGISALAARLMTSTSRPPQREVYL